MAITDRREIQLLTLPAVVWYLIFLLGPLLMILLYSFLTYQNFGVEYTFSLTAYTDEMLDSTTLVVFGKTLAIATAVTVLALILGYPIAYYMRFYLDEVQGLTYMLFLVIIFYTSLLVRLMAYLPILGKQGIINQGLLALGVINDPIGWMMFSPFAMAVGYLENYILFMIAPIYISLTRVDEDLLNASHTLRGDPIETFRNVVWPLSLPGVAIGTLFVFVATAGDNLVPLILGGGGASVTSLILSYVTPSLNYPAASAISLLLLVTILLISAVILRLVDITEISEA
jgi:putative spermidine/putrescine transport system permease protein